MENKNLPEIKEIKTVYDNILKAYYVINADSIKYCNTNLIPTNKYITDNKLHNFCEDYYIYDYNIYNYIIILFTEFLQLLVKTNSINIILHSKFKYLISFMDSEEYKNISSANIFDNQNNTQKDVFGYNKPCLYVILKRNIITNEIIQFTIDKKYPFINFKIIKDIKKASKKIIKRFTESLTL